MGGDIVKMGKSLFNTRVNPKLLEFIAKNQKIPPKILENIKIHARTLKNTTENQKNLFLENIKSIQKAKTHQKYRLNPSRQSLASINQDQAARNFQHGPKVGLLKLLKAAKTVWPPAESQTILEFSICRAPVLEDYYRRAWGIGDRSKFKPGGIVEPGARVLCT